GGAYAVLPYVYQGAVEHFHWLSGPQMIDGLALGETTPGPLIMVVSYVGFVGGWTEAFLGPQSRALAAAAVVGVIANLALFFALHVLWPQGPGGGFDIVSALIGVAAEVALFRFKAG